MPATPTTWSARFVTASREAAEQEAAEREAARQRELDAAHRAADAERARADDQARSARRLKRGAVVLVGLLVVAVALAGFSFVQVQRADEATVEAVSQADLAQARELSAAADSQLTTDPELSVLLAREAVDRRSDPATIDRCDRR